MSSIDDRIVNMRFNNRQFQNGVKDTLDALDRLKAGLNIEGAAKGLDGAQKAAQSVADGVENISSKFGIVGALGFTAIQRLTNAAIDSGKAIGASLVDPIVEGGRKRALNLEQARFQFENLKMDVVKTMSDVNYAVDGTAYSLDAAASAAAQLGASNVELGDDMRAALRGISGVAALTGSSYEDISSVFTKVAGQSRVMGDDLRRLEARGMNAAAVLAEKFGVTEEAVRQMVSEGKVSFNDFSTALDEAFGPNAAKANDTYVGSLSNVRSALARIGALYYEGLNDLETGQNIFNGKLERQRDLFNALRPLINNVRTMLLPLFHVWSDIENIANDNLIRIINGIDLSGPTAVIERLAGWVRKLMLEFKMGDKSLNPLVRTLNGVKAAFSIVWTVLKGIGGAIGGVIKTFTSGFGKGSGGILGFTSAIGDWLVYADRAIKAGGFFSDTFTKVSDKLQPVADFMKRFGDNFRSAMKNLTGGDLASGFKELPERVAALRDRLAELISGPVAQIKSVFGGLGHYLSAFGTSVTNLFSRIGSIIGDFGGSAGASIGSGLASSLSPLEAIGDGVGNAWERIIEIFKRVRENVGITADVFRGSISSIGDGVRDFIQSIDPNVAIGTLNLGIVATVATMIKNLLKPIQTLAEGGAIAPVLDGVTGALKGMQNELNASALLKVAGAIVVLAAGVGIMAMIPADRLGPAIAAITAMTTNLLAAMYTLSKITSAKGFAQIPILSVSLMLLGGALVLFAIACQKFASVGWEDVAKAMAVVGLMIGTIAIMTKTQLNPSTLAPAAAGLLLLAIALGAMSLAIRAFDSIEWDAFLGGLAKMSLTLLLVVAAMHAMPQNLPAMAAGLLVVSASMAVLAGVLAIFSRFSPEGVATALGVLGGSLGILVIALNNMMGTAKGAAALVVAALAINVLAGALMAFSLLSPEGVAKSLLLLGGALGIIVAAMYGMQTALPGAAALLVVAAALSMLAPVLVILGSLSLEHIGKGLLAIAGVFLVIGVAAAVMAPIVPVLVLLGAGLALMGIGALAAGQGMMLFATGLGLAAAAGATGVPVLLNLIKGLINLLPHLAKMAAQAMVAFVKAIAEAAPVIAKSVVAIVLAILDSLAVLLPEVITLVRNTLLQLIEAAREVLPELIVLLKETLINLLEAIKEAGPVLIDTLFTIVMALVDQLVENVPLFVKAAYDLVIGIIDGIAEKIPDVIVAGTGLVMSFIEGLGKAAVEMADAAFKIIIDFINGIADAIDENIDELIAAGQRLAQAIGDGMVKGLESAPVIGNIIRGAKALGTAAINATKDALDSHSPSREFIKIGKFVGEGFRLGLLGSREQISAAYSVMRGALKDFIKSTEEDIKKLTENDKKLVADRKKLKKDLAALEKETGGTEKQRKDRIKSIKDHEKALKDNSKALKRNERDLKRAREEAERARKAREYMIKNLKDERDQLKSLSKDYEKVTNKLEAAQKTLEDAIKTRDDYRASITDQYSQFGSIDEETTLSDFIETTQKQVDDTLKFTTALQRLRDMGLSDSMYEHLLTQGPEALPFLLETLEAGQQGIADLNKLGKGLENAAKNLGKVASDELYQAAVDSAKGIVAGLKKEQKAIAKEMEKIADKMVKAIKKKLGIKSPSRVFFGVGQDSGKGLRDGFSDMGDDVSGAASAVGGRAIEALKDSLAQMDSLVSSDMELVPTIRPVLDLSSVQKDSNLINGMLTPNAITPHKSFAKAAAISADTEQMLRALTESMYRNEPRGDVNFYQTNNSPKALSNAELYRQTKNQLSVMKGGLPQ